MNTLLLLILAAVLLPHLKFQPQTNMRIAWVLLIVAVVLFIVFPWPFVRPGNP